MNVYLIVRSGDYEIVSGTVSEWNDTTLLLASNDRNYIWAEDPEADGTATVETSTSGYPGSGEFVKLWRVDTDADSVTDKIDDRPADLTDSTTDTSSSDLVLSESIPITDQDLLFEHLLRLEDVVNLDDMGLLPALGLATLDPEDFSVADGPLDALGLTSFTDTLNVLDGGSASSGGGSTSSETAPWGTATDWDNALAENGVVHEGFGDHSADWIDLGFPSSDPAHYYPLDATSATDVSGNADATINGSPAIGQTGTLGTSAFYFNGDYLDFGGQFGHSVGFAVVVWVVPDSTGNVDAICHSTNGSSNIDWWWDDSVPEQYLYADYTDGTRTGLATGSISVSRSEPNMFALVARSGATELWFNGSMMNSNSKTVKDTTWGYFAIDDQLSSNRKWPVTADEIQFYNYAPSSSEMQALWDTAASGGSLTTAWKSFSGDVDLNSLELQNVVASLNNQSITVYVESDTNGDGTVDETSDAISLDGSGGPYQVTGLTSPSSRFRLDIDLSTTNRTRSPQFDDAELAGTVGSGGDADQNPNTQWEILGAKHDTSGNEYEGGGVVSRYGG